jgi:translation initiation factor 3 subunit E
LLYKLGRFQYTIGQYQAAADYLYHFRVLTVDPELEASAMWGKLASNILDGDWDAALNELDLLRKHIDALYPATSASSNAVVGLQQRTWFLHWSLFVYFNHPEGRDKLVDAWLSQTPLPASLSRDGRDQQAYLLTYLPTLQANAPWLLRYLVAAVVLSKRAAFKGNTYLGALARIATKEQLGTAVLTAIRQETYQYSDPVTDFLRALFFDLDFKAAGEYLKQSEEVVANDFFLAEFKDEWKERARYLYSEAYCRIHNQIDIGCVLSLVYE